MQAYPGNDGVVISLTPEECEDMVAVASGLPMLPIHGRDTFIKLMDAIAELKEDA
jgi:hypothetical protein